MKKTISNLLAVLIVFFSACGPGSSKKDNGCGDKTVPPQNFKTDVAWIVTEWNCKPGGYGSGFLIDKERGVFFTNKHVTNEFNSYGKGSHKIYFNGKFYNAEIVKVPPLRDAAMVRITDEFDSSKFPEPAPFAVGQVKKGDLVFVEGFHPHPYGIIESDKTGGYNEIILALWDKYYNLGTRNLDKKQEIVYEKISGKIIELDAMASFGGEGTISETKELSNTYTMVKTDRDHKFSFGGLSGTVVRNAKGETIGIFTMGPPKEFEKDEKMGDAQLVKRVFKTFGFTPIESVANLKEYLDKK